MNAPLDTHPAPVAVAGASREQRLVLACAASACAEQHHADINNLLLQSLDWNAVLKIAEEHHVRPLLFAILSTAHAGLVPPPVLQALRDFSAVNARRSMFLAGEMFRLVGLFQARGIRVVPFKGPTLAMTAYGNLSLREAGDLDLLVPRDCIIPARQMLIDSGFRPAFPTATPAEVKYLNALRGKRLDAYLSNHCEHHFLNQQGVNIDLHWALAIRQFALPLSLDELWRWVSPQRLNGKPLQGFAAEEMLLVLCINGAKDCWQRLDRICDVARLIRSRPDMNWRRVFVLAARIGATRMVCVGLQLAADLLGTALPAEALAHVSADANVRKIVRRVRADLFLARSIDVEEAGFAKSFLHLMLRERLRDRIAYCMGQLEPTVGDRAAIPLPPALHFLHYFFRPCRLVWRYGLRRSRD